MYKTVIVYLFRALSETISFSRSTTDSNLCKNMQKEFLARVRSQETGLWMKEIRKMTKEETETIKKDVLTRNKALMNSYRMANRLSI